MSEKPTTSIAPDEDDAPHFTREMAERGEHAVGTHVLQQADPPLRTRRGRPALAEGERKQQVTLRLSPDVLAHFRSTGEGWQTRIDEALRAHIAAGRYGRQTPLSAGSTGV